MFQSANYFTYEYDIDISHNILKHKRMYNYTTSDCLCSVNVAIDFYFFYWIFFNYLLLSVHNICNHTFAVVFVLLGFA